MLTPPQQLLALSKCLGTHLGLTHWAISTRFTSKGDFFDRLEKNPDADMRTRTYSRLLQSFSNDWPADLEWPADIPRPEPQPKEAAQ